MVRTPLDSLAGLNEPEAVWPFIAGSVSDDEAKKIYPDGWKSPRPYLRIVPQPK